MGLLLGTDVDHMSISPAGQNGALRTLLTQCGTRISEQPGVRCCSAFRERGGFSLGQQRSESGTRILSLEDCRQRIVICSFPDSEITSLQPDPASICHEEDDRDLR